MLKVRYKNDITQFVLQFENWNVKAKVTGIAFRMLITDHVPDEPVRRMSMHQEYADDRDCLEALGQAVRDKEHFHEEKRPKDNNFSWSNSSGKRKSDEPTTAKTGKNLGLPLKQKGSTRRRKRRRR